MPRPRPAQLPDLDAREGAVLLPLVVLALVMGVASPYFTRTIEPSVDALVLQVRQHLGATQPAVAVDAARGGERGR